MKKIEIILTLIAIMLMIGGIANAQTPADSSTVGIPESYQETQEQLQEDGTVGAATYNIDENKPAAETGAAEWRDDGEVEELRVYSGRHDGNNQVKTIQMKTPAKNTDSNNYRPE